MSISLRSVRSLIKEQAKGKRVSKKAIMLVKEQIEGTGRSLVLYASRIQDRENIIRAQVGEREKVILTEKHLKMALEGKYPELRSRDYDDRQS